MRTEIHQKKMAPRIPPVQVTQGHWNQQRSISNLRLLTSDP